MTVLPPSQIETLLQEHIARLNWSAQATDYEKTLVIGNLRQFAGVVEDRYVAALELRNSELEHGLRAVTFAIEPGQMREIANRTLSSLPAR